MSTRISKPLWTSVAVLALGGCVGLDGLSGGFSGGARVVDRASLTSDQIVIVGPDGFCPDPTSRSDAGDSGFILLGNCAAISGEQRAPQPEVPAVLTAALSAPGSSGQLTENLSALDAFFRSETGRRLLSRDGDSETVEILDTRIEGDMFFLHARDSSAGAMDGVAQDYWRAYLDIGPRLATLSVLALAHHNVSDAQALTTLRGFSQAVQAANPSTGNAVVPQTEAREPAEDPQNENRGFMNGLFRRITG